MSWKSSTFAADFATTKKERKKSEFFEILKQQKDVVQEQGYTRV
jgi:hypothetical protein